MEIFARDVDLGNDVIDVSGINGSKCSDFPKLPIELY
jgi:hypothetical protein